MAAGQPESPVALTRAFGDVNLGTCAYHMRILLRASALKLVDTRDRRGAKEHLYVLSPYMWAELEEFISAVIATHRAGTVVH